MHRCLHAERPSSIDSAPVCRGFRGVTDAETKGQYPGQFKASRLKPLWCGRAPPLRTENREKKGDFPGKSYVRGNPGRELLDQGSPADRVSLRATYSNQYRKKHRARILVERGVHVRSRRRGSARASPGERSKLVEKFPNIPADDGAVPLPPQLARHSCDGTAGDHCETDPIADSGGGRSEVKRAP